VSELAGRVAVVTGAASGIGAATVEVFVREGARVAALDVAPIPASAGVLPVRCDVAEEDEVAAALATVDGELGPVDVLVNQAGIIPRGPLRDLTVAEWDRTMAVNVRSMFLTCRALIPGMVARGGGVVVNCASGAAFTAGRELPAYTASKGAVLALTRALAVDSAPDVRVNAVCPGLIDTPGPLAGQPASLDANRRRAAAATPLGRLGTPAEVAEAILWLASPRSSFATGSALVLDGGKLAT
jgi:NAD(P)-dependent dehydrogenase (short-subunit alcohol dehydrogenase family)